MVYNKKMRLCIVGAGRVGTTVAYVIAKKNLSWVKIKSISSRTNKSLSRAKKILSPVSKNIYYTQNKIEAAAGSECILICTPDDMIEEVCVEISSGGVDLKDCIVIHFSGSKSLKVLNSAREGGAHTASVHPLKSFASIEDAIKTIPGTVFGVTSSSERAKNVAAELVKILGGSAIKVEDNKKPLYHAAACVASNYLVALINYAVAIHERIGIDPHESLEGLMSLVEGTIENIKKMGTKKSLTGPIARGDIGTIEEHLVNFKKYFKEDDVVLYKLMGVETGKIAYQNKWISGETYKKLAKILEN